PEDVREEVAQSLTYPEESAGRLMRKALVAVPESWSVGQTIDYLRSQETLPEQFYLIYTVDGEFRAVGRLLLGQMLQQKREVKLAAIVSSDLYAVTPTTDQEEVAHLFRKYAIVETPVLDETGRLVGTITVDDVVDVIQEEEEEDDLAAGGVRAQDFQSRLLETVKTRFRWLFVNLLTAVLAAAVIGQFEGAIEAIVALAILMPMVASMGGNAGTQAVTVAVRAIATKSLTSANQWSHIRKEMLIGMMNGLGLGLLMALGAYFWFHQPILALVLFLAALATMAMAGLFGALIPIILHRRGIDPAIASTIFLTTVTDCVGFLSFLGLASWILL
ncbi:MAG: magnesium transporter, partial [Alphaproteobacteria bacterium]